MKYVLILSLALAGCSTTQTSQQQPSVAKTTLRTIGAIFSGAGNGLQNVQRNTYYCRPNGFGGYNCVR